MNEYYNRKNIRDLLIEGFSEKELRDDLCFYETDFQSLHDQLPQGVGKDVIVQSILDFALQKVKVDQLLEWAKVRNPIRYEKHKPYIRSEQTPNEHNIAGTVLRNNTKSLQQQLLQHQSTLNKLKEELAIYAVGQRPVHLLTQIEHKENEIARLKAELGYNDP